MTDTRKAGPYQTCNSYSRSSGRSEARSFPALLLRTPRLCVDGTVPSRRRKKERFVFAVQFIETFNSSRRQERIKKTLYFVNCWIYVFTLMKAKAVQTIYITVPCCSRWRYALPPSFTVFRKRQNALHVS